jgi:hypothetical protein
MGKYGVPTLILFDTFAELKDTIEKIERECVTLKSKLFHPSEFFESS